MGKDGAQSAAISCRARWGHWAQKCAGREIAAAHIETARGEQGGANEWRKARPGSAGSIRPSSIAPFRHGASRPGCMRQSGRRDDATDAVQRTLHVYDAPLQRPCLQRPQPQHHPLVARTANLIHLQYDPTRPSLEQPRRRWMNHSADGDCQAGDRPRSDFEIPARFVEPASCISHSRTGCCRLAAADSSSAPSSEHLATASRLQYWDQWSSQACAAAVGRREGAMPDARCQMASVANGRNAVARG